MASRFIGRFATMRTLFSFVEYIWEGVKRSNENLINKQGHFLEQFHLEQLEEESNMSHTAVTYLLFALASVLLSGQTLSAEINLPKTGISLTADMTVGELKLALASKFGILSDDIVLTLDGKTLDEESKLVDNNIFAESNLDYKYKEVPSSTRKPSRIYFGVDADDEEAVRRKQRELSEEKFKELFGEEALFDMDHPFPEEKEEEHGPHHPGGVVKDALKWMSNMAKQFYLASP